MAVAVVTGGAGDIGIAVGECLLRAGFFVSAWDRDVGRFDAVSNRFMECNLSFELRSVDVSDVPAVRSAMDVVESRYGPIDVLVTCAGHHSVAKFLEMEVDEWHKMLEVHLTGSFACAQAAARRMVTRRSGKIVFLSSIGAFAGSAGSVHYAAAKAGITGMCRALARELGASGISVNCIAPGAIDTRMLASIDPGVRAKFSDTPAGRVGVPSDIADAVRFIVGLQDNFFTGQVLHVNGGVFG